MKESERERIRKGGEGGRKEGGKEQDRSIERGEKEREMETQKIR